MPLKVMINTRKKIILIELTLIVFKNKKIPVKFTYKKSYNQWNLKSFITTCTEKKTKLLWL